ncbi:Anaphase-promoting complex subunit 1 [Loxospora ochrophaea]|nr:Anaphase-promoting complex subunit 1 [Loxospora ochrophaea]
MASVKSLGIHRPSAIPYLVAEGILPPEPAERLYTWQTIPQDSLEHGEEEELVTTDHCVVWSKGGVARRIFRFEIEAEPVIQAVITRFPESSKSSVFRSTQGDASYSSGEDLNVHKRRRRSINSATSNLPTQTDDRKGERSEKVTLKKSDRDHDKQDRALVVLLKTQAHVFFLYGTKHSVHLPFEVDAVFPLPQGILLQRKLTDKVQIQQTPRLPSVPPNSFAYSNPTSSWTLPSSQNLQDTVNQPIATNISDPLLPFLSSLLRQSNSSLEVDLPGHFCLTDPLSEMGIIELSSGISTRSSSAPGTLDPQETLLYVSPHDELKHLRPDAPPSEALIFAMTANESTGMYSLWTVTYTKSRYHSKGGRRRTAHKNGPTPRRRSSYGPGTGTGATTPNIRTQQSARESYGGSVGDPSFLEDESIMASQLDPAFENPSAPAKSSRRISSLLARADLSTNHDRSAFTDLAGGHSSVTGARRGANAGVHGSRLSAAKLDYPNKRMTTSSHSDFHMDLIDPPSTDELLDESDSDVELSSFDGLRIRDAARGLRKEMAFTKVRSVPYFEHSDQQKASRSRSSREVFVLQPPVTGRGSTSGTDLVLCLIDRSSCQLLVFQIQTSSQTLRRSTKSTHRSSNEEELRVETARVRNFTRSYEVIDACKISEGVVCRIFILRKVNGGLGDLTLEAPWSTLFKIQLPIPLLLHSPFQTSQIVTRIRRREGGYKRVLSQGPQSLQRLEHAEGQNRVDVIDEKGVRHRIEIQLLPNSSLVKKLIHVCESVLPGIGSGKEPILRAWWDCMSWLRGRTEEEEDIEWTALVVVLFSMAVEFIDDRQTQNAIRQKKKRGLLRSSSGASVDMESWNAMLILEGKQSNVRPQWMTCGAWDWTASEDCKDSASSGSQARVARSSTSSGTTAILAVPTLRKSSYLIRCIALAREFLRLPSGSFAVGKQGYLPTAISKDSESRRTALPSVLIGLHLFREELKLDILASNRLHKLTPVLAQIGGWLGWQAWSWMFDSYYVLESADMEHWLFDESLMSGLNPPPQLLEPPSIFNYVESITTIDHGIRFTSLLDIVSRNQHDLSQGAPQGAKVLMDLTPRTMVISHLLNPKNQEAADCVARMSACGIEVSTLESFPEGIAAPLRAAIAVCQAQPLTAWTSQILTVVGRDDIGMLDRQDQIVKSQMKLSTNPSHEAIRDVHTICNQTLDIEPVGAYDGSAELDRQSITRMIFKEDQRFAEAAKLVHPLKPAQARCNPEPDWSDTDLLEAQQELVKVIAVRTLSVSPGRGMLFYSARIPLLTEKFPIHGFTLSCVMRPANTTVTADRNIYTEEKVSWAFFHAGVEAGLSISRGARGIDTSWILFNKPTELNNRHAGFLLALGLNGHLKSIAKWVAFKYLTPKHTMTSIGLLLGLSASYLGTMDNLITRLLSIHVTRMLPPNAAELNLSPLTQTTGIMGIGILYCNTQHRRMSEIMLSEMENVDQDDVSSPMDTLRDEGYRLAAGFALGYINLGKGKDLRGLHDMHIVERLLVLAVGTRKVDIVHILDKATAAATIAVALIFMKTHDEALARKIDIPDTVHQFDYVRPDIFLLRTLARHLVMWNNITPTTTWMKKQLPVAYQSRINLVTTRLLSSEDMPLFNIIAGLCFSIGLRFAGTGRQDVRNLLRHYLEQFMRICRLPALNYDGKLTRITVRNCQDAVALAAACVMAGTGDISIFRYLRSLHGRTDPDTPYGSHLATHMAIGVLFLGGGTHTFGTSNVAIASLICAFYPLFPTMVLDNKSHLQAFRHFWVLAAEPRCVVARDVDTQRPASIPILVTLHSGTELSMTTPCLLPEVDTIASVKTTDPEYWQVTLDFSNNPKHLSAFRRHQSIYVRRRSAYEAHTSVFSSTLRALNDAHSAHQLGKHVFEWIFDLPSFQTFDWAERALVLPPDGGSALHKGTRGTVVDDRLVLERASLESGKAERLWNLRVLFAWAEAVRKRGGKLAWLSNEVVEGLRAEVWLRGRD